MSRARPEASRPPAQPEGATEPPEPVAADALALRHLRFGWWSLLAFLSLGIALELLHGFKVGFYLDVANDTRRLMWTLAHAHGALLGLVHVGFAFTLTSLRSQMRDLPRAISPSLIGASILLPGGFFLGGLWIYGGDPGRGVLLVPVGALLLLVAVLGIALGATRARA